LKLSLEQLGYEVNIDAKVRRYRGQSVRADVVVVLEGDYDIGWSLNTDGSFDMTADYRGVSERYDFRDLINSINQQYSLNAS